jgi:hypothetical protein
MVFRLGNIEGEAVEFRCRVTLEVKRWSIGVGVTMR